MRPSKYKELYKLFTPFFLISTLYAAENETTQQNKDDTFQYPSYSEQQYQDVETISYELPYQETGFHVTGQFLYWQTLQANMVYGIDQPLHANGADQVSLEGNLKKNSYRWDPGFRAGGGYMFSPETFDVNLEFTYFHNGAGNSTNLKENRFLKGVFPNTLDPMYGPITNMQTKADLDYAVLDFYATHIFHKNENFVMRFLTGVQGAWISKGASIYYKTNFLFDPALAEVAKTVVQNNWKYSGAGLRFGLSMDWFIVGGISLHCEGNFAAIVGRFRSKYKIDQTVGNHFAKTYPSDTRVIPNAQLILGFAWRKMLSSIGVKAFANWELNLWNDLSQTYMYPTTAASNSFVVGSWVRNSLNLQGITAGFAAEF